MKQILALVLVVGGLITMVGGAGAMEEPHSAFTVPWFEVAPAPSGTTTLFAVTNVGEHGSTVDIGYYDVYGEEMWTETVRLDSNDTFTRNIRDVIGHLTPESDGVARGYVQLQGGLWMTVDYFQIDPGNAYATGDRALATDSEVKCHNLQVRFLDGGAFSGGTELVFFFDGDTTFERSSRIWFYTEYGTLRIDRSSTGNFKKVEKFTMSDFDTWWHFGMMRIRFPHGGAVVARMSASGQYSLGLKAVCLDDIME